MNKPNGSQDPVNSSVSFIRHSKSAYRTYGAMLSSENPLKPFHKDEQVTPDLPEAWATLAKEEAEKLFSSLNPDDTAIFFVSSNEARAIETANIYREIAKSQRFEILKPVHTRSKLADEVSDGEIRVVNPLSLNLKNLLIDMLFNPPNKRGIINWDAIDPEFKARFEEASKIIEADDRGSFAANHVQHAKKVKEFFPEVITSEELFHGRFQKLKQLTRFGVQKALENPNPKKIKILAFGHENYLTYAIEHLFQEEGINNCEALHVDVEDSDIVGNFRGKEARL